MGLEHSSKPVHGLSAFGREPYVLCKAEHMARVHHGASRAICQRQIATLLTKTFYKYKVLVTKVIF